MYLLSHHQRCLSTSSAFCQGTYVFEDEYYVNSSGDFSGGIADIQCLYAPEFVGTSEGRVIGGW